MELQCEADVHFDGRYGRWSDTAGTVKNSFLGKGASGEEHAVAYVAGTVGTTTADRTMADRQKAPSLTLQAS